MSRIVWLVMGVVLGAAAAHVVSRTPTGARVMGAFNALTDEFVSAASDSYRARQAETR